MDWSSLHGLLRKTPAPLKTSIKRIWYLGRHRYCPICERSARVFLPFGVIPRTDAMCPFCGSLERHRLVWRYFTDCTDLFDPRPKKMLHVAPERCLEARFKKKIGLSYLTADLLDPEVMEKMDITAIQHPADSFDVIYCSHVLEHVADDRKAMREFRRVLRSTGWAVLLVPISAERTIEDPSITDPAERLRLFGQEDHVRRYGPDYVDRLHEVGFKVKCLSVSDFLTEEEAVRMAVGSGQAGQIFHCTK